MPVIPLGWLILVFLVSAAASFAGGYYKGSAARDAEYKAEQAALALASQKAQTEAATENIKIVEKWNDRVEIVEKRVPEIRRVVVERCSGGVSVGSGGEAAMPGASAVDPSRAAADAEFGRRLAEALENGILNTEQLRACQEFVKVHSAPLSP